MLAELELKTSAIPAHHQPIYRLEALLLTQPQVECPVEHAYCAGIYARTMHIPAGTVLTGAVHKHESFFVVRRGRIAVTTDQGTKVLEAGDQLVSPAGCKRAGLALEDTVVTTYHANPTDERDESRMWDLFVEPAPATLLEAA